MIKVGAALRMKQAAQLSWSMMDDLDKNRRAELQMASLAQLAWCQLAQVRWCKAGSFYARQNSALGTHAVSSVSVHGKK